MLTTILLYARYKPFIVSVTINTTRLFVLLGVEIIRTSLSHVGRLVTVQSPSYQRIRRYCGSPTVSAHSWYSFCSFRGGHSGVGKISSLSRTLHWNSVPIFRVLRMITGRSQHFIRYRERSAYEVVPESGQAQSQYISQQMFNANFDPSITVKFSSCAQPHRVRE